MPRNGSGTYTVPITYTPSTLASAADVNSNFTDMATAMTGSLPRNGEAGMTGQLLAADGTVSAPGIGFTNNADTGIRRTATGFALVVDGVDVLTLAATGASGFGATPLGALMPYAAATAPSGWLLCYGQAVSRTTYAALFAAIGTSYGAGDGSTTFAVPDLRGRVLAGLDNIGGSAASRLTGTSVSPNGNTLGAVGGAQTITLVESQLPANISNSASSSSSSSTSVTAPGGTTIVTNVNGNFIAYQSGGASEPSANLVSSLPATTTTTTTTSVTINPSGGAAHANVQPTMLVNYIIFAGV
jgi:microcystin-dependent protein